MEWLLDNNGLTALIAFALVLIPAVIIHELGHFFAGKAAGITILEFGIGFPPRMGRLFTWRGTEFTLNWLPLGGFVRPLGEDMVRQKGEDDENLDRQEAEERGIQNIKSVMEAKPLDRIFFLSAGAIANLISAFVLFIVIGMMGIIGSRIHTVYVDESSPLGLAGLQSGDVIESLNGERFIDPNDFFVAFQALQIDKESKIQVLRGDVEEPFDVIYTPSEILSTELTSVFVRIMGVVEDAPAGIAGIKPGDLVSTFNGEKINSIAELIEITGENVGNTVTLELLRDNEVVTVNLVPRVDPPEGEGSMGIEINSAYSVGETGIIYQPLFQQVIVQLPFRDAVQYSIDRFVGLFTAIAELPSQFAQGSISVAEARPVSIIGISQVGGEFLRQSVEEERPVVILNYIAIISIALGLTNLLPLPALDGGRILFVLIEIVRGRPIPPEREGVVHLLGLIFLLSLTVIIMINDIINPITDLLP